MTLSRVRGTLAIAVLLALTVPIAALAAPAGPPVRVGSSLALTGPRVVSRTVLEPSRCTARTAEPVRTSPPDSRTSAA